jgi:hypothetical protein
MACLCDERVGAAVFDESKSLLDATGTRFGRGADAAAILFVSDMRRVRWAGPGRQGSTRRERGLFNSKERATNEILQKKAVFYRRQSTYVLNP